MTSYMIRGGRQGKARLQLIANALRPSTLRLLQSAGIQEGSVCLDVGCGGGDVTLELARLVGPCGTVVGIDMDDIKLSLAQQDAAQERLGNVTFNLCDATALEADSTYDLVYARFLLTHLPEPQRVVQQMVRATKPGGVVVLEDLNHAAIVSYPACEAVNRYITFYNQVAGLKGADPEIGPKLPELLRQAGAEAIQVQVAQPTFLEGAAKRIHQVTLDNITEAVIAGGLATASEVAGVMAELEAFTQNPHTLISFPRIFQVWGYRSAGD